MYDSDWNARRAPGYTKIALASPRGSFPASTHKIACRTGSNSALHEALKPLVDSVCSGHDSGLPQTRWWTPTISRFKSIQTDLSLAGQVSESANERVG